ncbi:hypothetical protein [Paraburkholderia domus]|uniref:hypothetical protein n=1 Tax=Paraburkholderia domus TaxID=2793075 RepID=UPI00191340FC|nr:hypothetical protein [Paraburkholderia domus]MBK5058887.1 hypothetical protein [Burkholderia sp. R-70199]CAE6879825.1 hypothetical protein R70199_02457 [Paraburkholderia domus]
MPLQKDYITPATGATANYHVAKQVTLDKDGNCTSISLASYLSAEMQASGKVPLYTQQIVVDGLPPDGQGAFAYAEAQLVVAQPTDGSTPTYTNRYAFAGAEIVA